MSELPGDREDSRYPRWAQSAVVLVVTLTLPGLFGWLFHTRGGQCQFSPDTLVFRSRSEITFFSGSCPIYFSGWQEFESPLFADLVKDGFLKREPHRPNRWRWYFHWNDAWRDGYSELNRVFRHRDQLLDWSQAYPECAKLYWSESFSLLRSDDRADVLTGEAILNHCQGITDLDEMRQAIQAAKADPDITWSRGQPAPNADD